MLDGMGDRRFVGRLGGLEGVGLECKRAFRLRS